jgi:hypothetical protein
VIEDLLDQVLGMARRPYSYVVTPNVDHVVKLMDGRVRQDVYSGAGLKVCEILKKSFERMK